jgi:SAM-dependent methyltransferase
MTELSIETLLGEHIGADDFVRATLSGPRSIDGQAVPLRKVVIRRVDLQRGSVLQVSRFDGRQDHTSTVEALEPLIAEVAGAGFRHVTIHLTGALIEARVTKKGKLLASHTEQSTTLSTAHDRPKARLVAESAPFLEVLGLASGGSVKPTGQKKYRQINEFLRALLGTAEIEAVLAMSPLRVVDFGCGNAYLTFAVYHYFHEVLGLACEVRGLDRNSELITRANERAAALGWAGLSFDEGTIDQATLADAPQVVIALHACDTATDDALARAVEWEAPLIVVSPCCHHDVQRQMNVASAPADYASIVRSGMLKERLGDVLTDSLRCDLLGLVGYQTEVIEFISLEHTAKNLLIRARRTGRAPSEQQAASYTALRDQWHIDPYLQRLLGERVKAVLAGAD